MNYTFMVSNVHAGVWQNHYSPTDCIRSSSKLQVRFLTASFKTQRTRCQPLTTECRTLYSFLVPPEYDDQKYRVRAIHALVHKLPEKNRAMLDLLTNHLHKYVHINTHCAFVFSALIMSVWLSI